MPLSPDTEVAAGRLADDAVAVAVLRPGDWVLFDGGEHQVVGWPERRCGCGPTTAPTVVLAGHLMAAADFAVLDAPAPSVEPFGLLERPAEAVLGGAGVGTPRRRDRDRVVAGR